MQGFPLYIIARALVASLFIGLGASRLLAAAGVPGLAENSIGIGGMLLSALELAAGLMIAIGLQVRAAAAVLALFLVVDALVAHPFWLYRGAEFQGQWLHFLKNLSVIGGLLLLGQMESGRDPGGAGPGR